jgi:tetratricopeptide (TPR) repeat protein
VLINFDLFELARRFARAAPKEKNMKRTISLWLGLLAFALMPALAQPNTGKIHGHVTNPTEAPQGSGTVSLSTDGGNTLKFYFPVSAGGDYTGEAPAGNYMVIYRDADTPPGKIVDSYKGVKIVAGEDTLQDIDMSRKEFVDKMTPDQRKQLEELKKSNAAAVKANQVVNSLNTDLRTANQDIHDAGAARATAMQTLGATASRADIDAKEEEIKAAKYTDVETMMLKDTQLRPNEALMWTTLGRAQIGLKKYDEATATYKKALELESANKRQRPDVLGVSNAGLGEIYARQGKVPEANQAYDAAAAADPTRAAFYLLNEAVIFFQQNNTAAQLAAADKAIKADPNQALLYYIKGQALIQSATVDPKTQRIVLPDDCTAAYQKYLALAPSGPYANEVAGILSQAGQKISSNYKAPKK